YGKVRPGDEHPLAAEGLIVEGHIRAEGTVRRYSGEGEVFRALEVGEHRIAEDLFAVARLVARSGAGPRARCGEVHQPLGVRDGQRLEEKLVEEREDRGVCSDTEGEREDRHERYERRLDERSEGELQVGHGVSRM